MSLSQKFVLVVISFVALSGCAIGPSDYVQQQPGIIIDHSSENSQALLAEKAFIQNNLLTVQYRSNEDVIRASAALSIEQATTQDGSSLSLHLQQAILENNGLPVAQLTRVSDSVEDGDITKRQVLPVTSVALWREFRNRLISSVTPREQGSGIVIEFLKQDELFFYYDESGLLKSARLSDKPAELHIDDTYKFSDLMSDATALLDEYVPSQSHASSGEILFNTGDLSSYGYPFVYANQDSGHIVFLRRPVTGEECCEQSTMMLPQALVHTTDSHITGFLKQPIGSVARLFTLVLFKVVDTLTPKPLFLLDQQPIGPLADSEPMDPVAWEQTLDRLTNSQHSQGTVNYLVDGAAFFARFFDAVQSASESVDVRVYIFDNDHYALQIADMLKQRSKQIRVRVLVDGLGSLGAASTRSTQSSAANGALPNIINYLKTDSNIEVRLVDNTWLAGDHTKTILIDNRIAFLGGMNLGREYRYDWHDLMVELKGPVVDEIQHQFELAWRLQSFLGDIRATLYRKRDPVNKPTVDDVPIRLLLTRPGDSQILRAQLAAIARSRQRIYIQNAYFTSDDIIYELAKARRRGVDVRVIIPYESDNGAISRSNVSAMNAMLANGIRVFVYPRESHIKGAIYDGWVCLGSANFDQLSLRVNKELNIATSHPQTVQAFLDNIMIPDFENSVELTEPLPVKWSDFLMETIADQL